MKRIPAGPASAPHGAGFHLPNFASQTLIAGPSLGIDSMSRAVATKGGRTEFASHWVARVITPRWNILRHALV
jgi:hypothetical protein